MNVDVFNKNIIWNIDQIAVQINQAEKVRGKAKSGYYKAAVIMAASIAEALAYKLLDENKTIEMPAEDWVCKNSRFLWKDLLSENGSRLSICERIQPKFILIKQTDFKKVNEICLKLGLFSKTFFGKIEKVRTLRNKIHIQGLDNIDRSYNKRQVEFIGSVVNNLIGKIQ